MSQPTVLPTRIPRGIAHQRPSPRDIAAAAPPPINAPAILPSEQSLVSYSTVVCLRIVVPEDVVLSPQGTSIVSFHDFI